MTLLAFALAFAAFLLFGLMADGHHKALFGTRPDPRRVGPARLAAWLLLGAALPAALVGEGPVLGGIVWTAFVMAGAAGSFLLLHGVISWHKRSSRS